MTQRERQILNWIEENPLISQQELAEKAGITRSSVAVHISNLMKKGYIAGKWRQFFSITVPMITPIIYLNIQSGFSHLLFPVKCLPFFPVLLTFPCACIFSRAFLRSRL